MIIVIVTTFSASKALRGGERLSTRSMMPADGVWTVAQVGFHQVWTEFRQDQIDVILRRPTEARGTAFSVSKEHSLFEKTRNLRPGDLIEFYAAIPAKSSNETRFIGPDEFDGLDFRLVNK